MSKEFHYSPGEWKYLKNQLDEHWVPLAKYLSDHRPYGIPDDVWDEFSFDDDDSPKAIFVWKDSETKDLSAFQVVARLGTSTAVKEGIKAGLGISILSSRAIDTELKLGIIRALRVKGIPMVRSFYLVRDKRRVASPICQAFVDYLLKTAGDESN
jgi:DNA-binding transcriptional LysR family regulator